MAKYSTTGDPTVDRGDTQPLPARRQVAGNPKNDDLSDLNNPEYVASTYFRDNDCRYCEAACFSQIGLDMHLLSEHPDVIADALGEHA